MRILYTIVSLFMAFLLFMTGGRFLLLLFNADKSNDIVHWILVHSDYWVKPFFDFFHLANKGIDQTGGYFEPASLIAFVVYLVVGSLILGLLRSASSGWGNWGGWGSWRHA